MAVLVPTSTALAIAKLDRSRFNDIHAQGYYPCAPKTEKRFVRRFDANDVVGLTILARLLILGCTPRSGGPLACTAVDMLKRGVQVNTVGHAVHADGRVFYRVNGFPQHSAPVEAAIEINVGDIRSYVEAEILKYADVADE